MVFCYAATLFLVLKMEVTLLGCSDTLGILLVSMVFTIGVWGFLEYHHDVVMSFPGGVLGMMSCYCVTPFPPPHFLLLLIQTSTGNQKASVEALLIEVG